MGRVPRGAGRPSLLMMGSEGNLFLLKMSCYSSLPGGHSSLDEAGPQLDDQLGHFLVRGIQISSGIVDGLPPGGCNLK